MQYPSSYAICSDSNILFRMMAVSKKNGPVQHIKSNDSNINASKNIKTEGTRVF